MDEILIEEGRFVDIRVLSKSEREKAENKS